MEQKFKFIHGFEVTTSNVMDVYRHIRRVCDKCNSIEFPLCDRDIQCIERFLSKVLNALQLLNSLFNFFDV